MSFSGETLPVKRTGQQQQHSSADSAWALFGAAEHGRRRALAAGKAQAVLGVRAQVLRPLYSCSAAGPHLASASLRQSRSSCEQAATIDALRVFMLQRQ